MDAGVPEADAAPSPGDAGPQGTLTDDLVGGWRFEVGEAPMPILTCGVTIEPGTFEITCPDPSGPSNVTPTCMKVRNDLRLSGELVAGNPAALNGSADLIEEYAGDGCASAGYTSGVPMVTKGIAWLWAERTEIGVGEGFWSAVDGTWSFELTDAADPTDYLSCTVVLAGGTLSIDCPGRQQLEPIPGCWEVTASSITGSIGADAMGGELFDVFTREGTTCEPGGLPLHEEGQHIPITATRL